jgi:hypothetical protein
VKRGGVVSRYLTTIAVAALTGAVMLDSQTGGTWGEAEKVPGAATLNKGGLAAIASVSCPSAGNCGAGGYYTDSSGRMQALVDSQT